MKLFTAIAGCLALVGCATAANYEAVLNSWVGAPVSALVSAWGPPQSSFTNLDGSQVLEFSDQRSMQMGGGTYTAPQTTYNTGTVNAWGTGGTATANYSGTSTTYVQHQNPTYNINLSCKTRITVSSAGTITSWAWQGNNCKAMKPK